MKTKFIGIALVFTLLASFLGACAQTDGGGGASPSPAESPATSPATSPTTSPTTSP